MNKNVAVAYVDKRNKNLLKFKKQFVMYTYTVVSGIFFLAKKILTHATIVDKKAFIK